MVLDRLDSESLSTGWIQPSKATTKNHWTASVQGETESITASSVVQVSHRVDTIVPEMERVLFLAQGGLVGDGSPREMLRHAELSELFNTPLNVVEAQGFRQVLPG